MTFDAFPYAQPLHGLIGAILFGLAAAMMLVVTGLLVGFGTRMGSGSTSGHGVCGVSRLSQRSMLATAAFISAGIVTVALVGVVS